MNESDLSVPVKEHLIEIYNALDLIAGGLKVDVDHTLDEQDFRNEVRQAIAALDELSADMREEWPNVIGDE